MVWAVKGTAIGIGILILILTLFSLAKRKMQPTFSAIWSVFALLMIVLGIAMRLTRLPDYISWKVLIFLLVALCLLLIGIYIITLQISDLKSRIYELAMQISLLNEENRTLREQRGDGE